MNSGPDTVTGVEGLDSLPDEVAFVSAGDSAGSPCGHDGTFARCDIGTMPPGTITMTVVGTVTEMPPDGILVNFCTVFPDNDSNPDNNHCRVETTVIDEPFLEIEKTDSPDPVEPGNQLTYTVTVRNTGTQTAEDVVVVDTLPDKVTFSTAAGCTAAGQQVTCSVGDMPAGSTAIIQIFATVVPDGKGTIENVVMATGTNTNTAQASEPTTIVCIPEGAFTDLDIMENKLKKMIEEQRQGDGMTKQQVKRNTKFVDDVKLDMLGDHFPDVCGAPFDLLYLFLEDIDDEMSDARRLFGNEFHDILKDFNTARGKVRAIRSLLEGSGV